MILKLYRNKTGYIHMTLKHIKITMLWKFVFWPVVWLLIFLPALIWPVSLDGAWLIVSRIAGVILFSLAMFLTSTGGRTLVRFGHRDSHETVWSDKFTEFGIFKCMRHPMHLGLGLFPLAIALISGLVWGIWGSGWGVASALWFVVQIEEKDVLEKFGPVYTSYMQRVPPFSLKPGCIKEGLKIWKL
jgi:protein-S-isoprenylcysteine O-methyltransferase Ste14